MILQEISGNGLVPLIIGVYLVCHSPAILMIIIGFIYRKTKPKTAKILFIISAVYFLIGLGICGSMF